MADYTKSTNFTAKDTAQAVILGADHDAEFNAIASAIATKVNKITSPTANRLVSMDASGNLLDSGHSQYELPTMGTREAIGTGSSKTKSLTGTVEEIEVILDGVSTATANEIVLCIGNGGALDVSGYKTGAEGYGNKRNSSSFRGFYLHYTDNAAATLSGILTLRHSGSNLWVLQGTLMDTGNSVAIFVAGSVVLAGACNIVGIKIDQDLDYFDAGGYWRVNYRRSA